MLISKIVTKAFALMEHWQVKQYYILTQIVGRATTQPSG